MALQQLIKKFTRGGPRLEDSDTLNNMIDAILYGPFVDIIADTALDQNYSGRILLVTNASNVNLTLSKIKKGFQCNIVQVGAGSATPIAGVGTTINSQSSFTKTAGQYAMIGLYAIADNSLILFGQGA